MFKVGLTGGIGSGKSTVAAMFETLGVAVFDADRVARDLVAPGSEALAEIVEQFGDEIVDTDGTLDRTALRRRIFADPSQRRLLESILHPRILRQMYAAAERAPGPYVVLVMPLLVEARQQQAVDRVLVVDCAPELQRRRAMARDANSAEEVERIVAAQVTRAQRLAAADDVIVNDADLQHLETHVQALHQRYCRLAGL